MEEYKKMWRNYAVFTGRSTRRDYWMAMLIDVIVAFGIATLAETVNLPILTTIYTLATFIPGLALMVRRFHDTNNSGWYCFIYLLPLVGWIIGLVILCSKSVEEGNRFGEIVE